MSRYKPRRQVSCACGCGNIITTPNKQCKEIRYCHGHANRVLRKGILQTYLQRFNEEKRIQHFVRDDVEGKVCVVCKTWKPLEKFGKHKVVSDGLETRCNECLAQKSLNYYYRHREHIREVRKSEDYKRQFRSYQARWEKNRRDIDPAYRLKRQLRCQLWSVLKGKKKSKSIMELLGCSTQELKVYLEKQFKNGMTWENYGQPKGKKGWEVDHIRPCASFDFFNPEELAICFHYTNLQPLWGKDNWYKQTKILSHQLQF